MAYAYGKVRIKQATVYQSEVKAIQIAAETQNEKWTNRELYIAGQSSSNTPVRQS